ncbi:MAG: 25S rRNA (adenine645-N1)-methyltransferase [Caeruleum heppii]|nr:MAG: 25S rRNA (adenine645-N1)-methyltransferase [Caeruleum heppii]
MFAVPGWSVAASALKTQTSNNADSSAVLNGSQTSTNQRSSKKRKRNGIPKDAVSMDNLADMWERVIEGKESSSSNHRARKAPKNPMSGRQPEDAMRGAVSNRQEEAITSETSHQKPPSSSAGVTKLTLKEKRKKKKREQDSGQGHTVNLPAVDSIPERRPGRAVGSNSEESVHKELGLTPLQSAMRLKLTSARFRHINQTLYTAPSIESANLFSQNPEMFQEYHEGFRRQVDSWPQNPVDAFIEELRRRSRVRGSSRRGPEKKTGTEVAQQHSETNLTPLPRTDRYCNVADLGCGDAKLARSVREFGKKFKTNVLSYDLQSTNDLITVADIANLPLKDSNVDVCIFCLALMGTNWIDFIEEAFRILRWKGELWIAEIKSRFGRGSNQRVNHSVGKNTKLSKAQQKSDNAEVENSKLRVEVDGIPDSKAETSVSAFVEVLKRRGFALSSDENAVDLTNKMFVKMKFVKSLTPVAGKGVPAETTGAASQGAAQADAWKKKPKLKFVEREEGEADDESLVLKPCVYKLR